MKTRSPQRTVLDFFSRIEFDYDDEQEHALSKDCHYAIPAYSASRLEQNARYISNQHAPPRRNRNNFNTLHLSQIQARALLFEPGRIRGSWTWSSSL